MAEARTGVFGRGSSKTYKEPVPTPSPRIVVQPAHPHVLSFASERIKHHARTDASTDATTKETTNTRGSESVETAHHVQPIRDVMVVNNFQLITYSKLIFSRLRIPLSAPPSFPNKNSHFF